MRVYLSSKCKRNKQGLSCAKLRLAQLDLAAVKVSQNNLSLEIFKGVCIRLYSQIQLNWLQLKLNTNLTAHQLLTAVKL